MFWNYAEAPKELDVHEAREACRFCETLRDGLLGRAWAALSDVAEAIIICDGDSKRDAARPDLWEPQTNDPS